MSNENTCACNTGTKLIFACSGAADVGAVADQAARKLTRDGAGKMYCLAGIGGRVRGIIETTKAASAILAIDGCASQCAKHCLEEAGFSGFAHVQLVDLGMEKGKTPVDDVHVAAAAAAGAARLNDVSMA